MPNMRWGRPKTHPAVPFDIAPRSRNQYNNNNVAYAAPSFDAVRPRMGTHVPRTTNRNLTFSRRASSQRVRFTSKCLASEARRISSMPRTQHIERPRDASFEGCPVPNSYIVIYWAAYVKNILTYGTHKCKNILTYWTHRCKNILTCVFPWELFLKIFLLVVRVCPRMQ